MHIHILAIAGTMTAPLAAALKLQGHTVTGSDQDKIYPPVSNILKKAGIVPNTYQLDHTTDLVIVGSGFKAFSRTREEYQKALDLHLPLVSATQYIGDNIGKKESILVAGSYGKTTITSLMVWIFSQAGKNPSYMFGGYAVNHLPSIKFSDSEFSVIEADESVNGLDTQAKFFYYPLKYLILTSADWEHKDSYLTFQDNFEAFKKLVQKVPSDGIIVYNPKNEVIKKLIPFAKSKTIPYDLNLKFSTPLIGFYNQENISAAYTLCHALGIKDNIIKKAVASFRGIKRRLEIVSNSNHVYFIDDFAQSPSRVESAMNAVKQHFPENTLKVYFEPHASFLQNKSSLKGFNQAFSAASEVILSKISYNHASDASSRTTARDFMSEVGQKLVYLPLDSEIIEHYRVSLTPSDVLVHFSSGGLKGLNNLTKIINNFSKNQ